MLYEGFRQIFNNSKKDVYTITKIQSVFGCSPYRKGGYYNNIVKYTKYVQEDDFENGIAFNPWLDLANSDDEDVVKVCVEGEEKIKINTIETYTVTNATNVTWVLDEETVNNGYAIIESQNSTSCTIRGLSENKWITVEARDISGNLLNYISVFCCKRK